MGDQSTLKLHKTIIMKAFIFATLVALASASPIEDTPEVAAAKAEFQAAFDAATAGEHAALAPAPVATAYLADAPDVAEAKAAFMKTFEDVEAGKVALPVAPVAPVVAAPQVLYNGLYHPHYYNGYAHHGYAGYYGYPGYYNGLYNGYYHAGYPYVTVKSA